jgi:hypothetical protein
MMRHIKHAQCLANAQTDVNRAVWAMNLDLDEKTLKQRSFFKDKAEVEAFIKVSAEDAIKSLQDYLTKKIETFRRTAVNLFTFL